LISDARWRDWLQHRQWLTPELRERLLQKEFWRFLAAGAAAAAANVGSRFLFSRWLCYEWSIVLAYLVGMVVAFLLMRAYVFNASSKPSVRQEGIFVAVNAVALLQTLLVSMALARWVLPYLGIVSQAEAIAHIVGVLVPVVTSYFGHRIFTFK
jgi:putative flippase GtrA